MKKKLLIGLCALLVLWSAMFITDYVRCTALKEPLFVVADGVTADDGGSGLYRGLGYTVYMEKYVDAEFGLSLAAVEMRLFGRVIAASIT